MQSFLKIVVLFYVVFLFSFLPVQQKIDIEQLREWYSAPVNKWPKPSVDEGIDWKPMGTLPKPNLLLDSTTKEVIKLGKQLFFDPRLSKSGQIACVSCHHPDQNWTDNRRVSMGNMLKEGKRNAPSILNLSYNKHFFWDGRASSLEEQLVSPITSEHEMNTPIDTLVNRINRIVGYRKLFKNILNKDSILFKDVSYAIATFEKSLKSRKSKFDYFLEGRKQLNDKELIGLHLFRTKARCMNCHHGVLLTDQSFHNLGLTYYGRKFEDLGKYNITKNIDDVGRFKTPSLRDVMRTRPWMHNGLFDKMSGILTMYNNGMPRPKPRKHQINDPLFPKTSPIIKKLALSPEEIENIISFLGSISAPAFKIKKPKLPE